MLALHRPHEDEERGVEHRQGDDGDDAGAVSPYRHSDLIDLQLGGLAPHERNDDDVLGAIRHAFTFRRGVGLTIMQKADAKKNSILISD